MLFTQPTFNNNYGKPLLNKRANPLPQSDCSLVLLPPKPPQSHWHHLKRCIEKGFLVVNKGNYEI